jgi:divalent metal cation (Fe/Co/Zn/Cd) transporter
VTVPPGSSPTHQVQPFGAPTHETRRADILPAANNHPTGGDALGNECCGRPSAPNPDPGWLRSARRARALSWVSLAWMTGEGVLGLVAGVAANSISLVGWALGSVIEALASIIVIWRFTGQRTLSEGAERHAQRALAISFFLLAPYLMVQSLRDLFGGHDVTPNALGLLVTATSLVVMPLLGRAKQRLGARLGSEATRGEGLQNLMCAAQAAAVLVGLAATATLGWSWLDPAIGLLLAGWAIYEGLEAWRGEDCC